jgi:DNA processing protein
MNVEEALFSVLNTSSLKEVKEEIKKAENLGVTLIPFGDERYPKALAEIHDPPFLLYTRGNVELLKNFSIAIVGSRKATSYGKMAATKLAGDLARCSITIVSGLAYGIDSSAHIGALKNGTTVAVLGNGVDIVYPWANRKLFNEIVQNGCVISEFPLGTRPQKWTFPKRNRIIVGLSMGVVVVEAAKRSGSLITARLALEEGREVFAVPGEIFSKTSEGTNDLIKHGAKCVTSFEDVLNEFEYISFQKESLSGGSKETDPIIDLLREGPKSVEELQILLGIPTSKLGEKLTLLEIDGMVSYDGLGKYMLR